MEEIREEQLSQRQMLQTLLSRQGKLSQKEVDIELLDDIELPFQTVAALQQLEIMLNEKATQKVMVSVKQHYIFGGIFQFYHVVTFSVCVCVCIYIGRKSVNDNGMLILRPFRVVLEIGLAVLEEQSYCTGYNDLQMAVGLPAS